MRELVARYAECRTYEDRGESITTFTPKNGGNARPRSLRLEFETAFDRACGGFRFEYRVSGLSPREKRAIVWRAKDGPARVWWSESTGDGAGELESILRVHTGTTSGVSTFVPSLLLARPLPWSLGLEERESDDRIAIPVHGRAMRITCRASDFAILSWTATPRRMRFGSILTGEPRSKSDATELLASSIEQHVMYEPRFDIELAASRFGRICG